MLRWNHTNTHTTTHTANNPLLPITCSDVFQMACGYISNNNGDYWSKILSRQTKMHNAQYAPLHRCQIALKSCFLSSGKNTQHVYPWGARLNIKFVYTHTSCLVMCGHNIISTAGTYAATYTESGLPGSTRLSSLLVSVQVAYH